MVDVLFGLVWFVILNIEHNLDNIDGIYFFAVLFCLFFIFSIHKVLDNFFNYILIIQFWPCLYFYPPAHGSHPGSDFFVFLVLFLCFFLSFDINFGNFREPKLCTVIVFIFFIESVEYNLSV